jgi:hypothetical protein
VSTGSTLAVKLIPGQIQIHHDLGILRRFPRGVVIELLGRLNKCAVGPISANFHDHSRPDHDSNHSEVVQRVMAGVLLQQINRTESVGRGRFMFRLDTEYYASKAPAPAA